MSSWSISFTAKPAAILTPCIGICELAADGYCDGCHRSTDEIANWSSMGDTQRRQLMDQVLPARARSRGDTDYA